MTGNRLIATERGLALVAAIFLIVVIGFLGVMVASLVGTQGHTSMNEVHSDQAYYLAEGGVEFTQLALAQNLEWYRSAIDPIATAATNLGAGTFAVNTYLPATMLRRRIPTAASTAAIGAYTTNRFPAAGDIQVEEDAGFEFIRYTGTTATTFTGITRNVTIGGVTGTAGAHRRRSRIYPVTTLADPLGAMAAACAPTAAASFRIVDHPKFLAAGTIDIRGEEIGYTGSTSAGGFKTLTGVTRCANSNSPGVAYAVGLPVTPLQPDGISPDYEAEVASTGTRTSPLGDSIRVLRKTVLR